MNFVEEIVSLLIITAYAPELDEMYIYKETVEYRNILIALIWNCSRDENALGRYMKKVSS